MSELNKTPWYPGDMQPVRIGVYQRDYRKTPGDGIYFCRWTGGQWCQGCWDFDVARNCFFASEAQDLPWRGVMGGGI